MGEGPVTAARKKTRPSWKLRPPHDAEAQGITITGFGTLPWAEALFLQSTREGAGWIGALRQVAPITDASGKGDRSRAAALAFTCAGLAKLGVEALDGFAPPFREGMYQEDRLRRLGDKIDGEWQGTVIPGGPIWSGNTLDERATPQTVHALLLLYAASQDDVRSWAAAVQETLAPLGVAVVRQLPLDLQLDGNGIAREHFGFADGISQPIPFGDAVVLGDGRPSRQDHWHGVPLGEILLDHVNAHNERAPGPLVADSGEKAARLTQDGAPEGFRSLGRNGSYMVVRELRQNVAAFWNALESGASRIRAHDPSASHVTADWLAERAVGRNLDGHLLCPAGLLAAAPDGQPENDVGFLPADRYGQGCPLGSHVRRSNPRDGLAKDEASSQTMLDAANNHRILRRGRKFGPPPGERFTDDGAERGLLFICLNSDIARQFEFIQQTWVMNQNFATLFDETDPIVGPKGNFTIAERPLRRIVEVETFVQLVGGEYFFLPSLPALDYLASL